MDPLPTQTTPRQRRRQAVLDRILDTAMATIVTRGIDALSINGLARDIDYTPGALYRYFSSKDALLAVLVSRVVSEIRAALEASGGAAPDAPPLQQVVALVTAYRRFAEDAPNRFALVSLVLAHPRVLLTAPDDAVGPMHEMIRALSPLVAALERCAAVGTLRPGDATERGLVVFAATQGVLSLRKQQHHAPGLISVPALLDNALRALLAGWGAPDSALAATAFDPSAARTGGA